jgi:hypothetical protein
MTRVITAMLATVCMSTVIEAKPRGEQYVLRAKVLESHIISPAYLYPLPAGVIRVDFDARFAVSMRVVSMRPPLANFAKNRTVTFAIHSPTMLFATPNPQGKTYDFTLRPPESRDDFWSLQVRWPNQAIQPTASPRIASVLHD